MNTLRKQILPTQRPQAIAPLTLGMLTGAALFALSVVPAFAAPNAAVPPSASNQFGETVEVSEVLLDVLVTDQKGDVVVGLQPEDFVIVEEGKEHGVTGASFYSNRFEVQEGGRQGVKKPQPGEVLADRYFILFFQDHRRIGNVGRVVRQQLEAGRQAQRWVKEEMLGGDWVAVVGYDVKLKIYSDFTRDRRALEEAVQMASVGRDVDKAWASRRPEVPEGQPSLLRHLPLGKELSKQSENMYDALSLVAEATYDIVGRKNLMLFSIGFGEFNQGLTREGTSRADERYYPGLKESLNDNNVAVYPIDLVPTEFRHSQENFLQELASDTGGYYHRTFVNFITPMRAVADEANGYYLLSYQATHPANERGYREIKVKTKNPEWKLRFRQGYRFGT
jgi:VWFA-related protein